MATKRTKIILERLDAKYGTKLFCSLDYENPWQLLVATMLSAQCTDERVNIVTKELFKKYRTVADFAKADLNQMEQDVRATGFYHNKAKNLIASAKIMLEKYNEIVPETIEELTALPGVGRKTANVIRGNIYNQPSIVVDTHVKRISKKLDFTKEEDPTKVEYDLMKVIPMEHWILYNIQIITFGREICTARAPKCEICFLNDLCRASRRNEDIVNDVIIHKQD